MANNFSAFKSEFQTDTGLDWKTNIDAYIQYVQARIFDQTQQDQQAKIIELITAVNEMQQKQQAKMTELIDAVKAIKLI